MSREERKVFLRGKVKIEEVFILHRFWAGYHAANLGGGILAVVC